MGNEILQHIPTLENDIPADQFMVQEFWVPLAWACAVVIPLAALCAWWLYRRNRKPAAIGITPLQEAMTALAELDTQLPPNRLQKLVFPHPTVAEIIREAIFHI